MLRPRAAVFVSGGGTNLQALLDKRGSVITSGDIALVISNKENAFALERARRAGVPAVYVPFDRGDPGVFEREAERLRCSFEAARAAGYRKYIVFLHYPPTSILEEDSVFTAMAEEYGAVQLIYAHCHGESRFHDSIEGEKNGILYSLVSGDFRKWMPLKLLD